MSKADALSEMTTIGDVLEHVAEVDRQAYQRLVDLAPRVSKSIRYIVEELAGFELDHVRRIEALAKEPKIKKHLKDAIRAPKADAKFSDSFHASKLGKNPDDQDVLQWALALEQAAIDEYTELADNAPSGRLNKVFRFLENEERKHKLELEKLYYEIIHSGGV